MIACVSIGYWILLESSADFPLEIINPASQEKAILLLPYSQNRLPNQCHRVTPHPTSKSDQKSNSAIFTNTLVRKPMAVMAMQMRNLDGFYGVKLLFLIQNDLRLLSPDWLRYKIQIKVGNLSEGLCSPLRPFPRLCKLLKPEKELCIKFVLI